MNRNGGLLVPFAIILSLFSLLLGALAGNAIGRKNQATNRTSPLDVYSAPPVPSPEIQSQK